MHVFIDSSVAPRRGAVGAYLVALPDQSIETMISNIQTVELKSVNSTDAELELAIYVLTHIKPITHIYTDCNNLYGIKNRHFSPTHKKASMYNLLLQITKDVEIIKIKGHNKASNKVTDADKIFGYVDKLARSSLTSNGSGVNHF